MLTPPWHPLGHRRRESCSQWPGFKFSAESNTTFSVCAERRQATTRPTMCHRRVKHSIDTMHWGKELPLNVYGRVPEILCLKELEGLCPAHIYADRLCSCMLGILTSYNPASRGLAAVTFIDNRVSIAGPSAYSAWPCHPAHELWAGPEYGIHCWAPKASEAAPVGGRAVPGGTPLALLPQPPTEGFATQVAAPQGLQVCLARAMSHTLAPATHA